MSKFFPLVGIIFIMVSCKKDFSDQWPYTIPQQLSDGIPVGTLDEVGIDLEIIQHIRGRIKTGDMPEIHSVLVMKNNKLVLEEYFKGHQHAYDKENFHGAEIQWNSQHRHMIMSCSKSITTTCIGLAIEQGYINSINDPIFNYLPAYLDFKSGGRERITIEHLVSMSSGIEWDEWSHSYVEPENDMVSLYLDPCEDPIECILSRSVTHTPGTFFTYSGANSALLGAIIKNATGMRIDDYANLHLFAPLGINTVVWTDTFPNGSINSSGGIKLTSREMLKVGSVYLNEGKWMGNQVVPSTWLAKCSNSFGNNEDIKIPGVVAKKQGYSYGWWVGEFKHKGRKLPFFAASGWGGQYIMVFKKLDLVIVCNGGTYASDTRSYELVERCILPFIN